MNTDTSDSELDSSQYRYAENLRIVTNTDSNSGELHLIDGTKKINLNIEKLSEDSFDANRDIKVYGADMFPFDNDIHICCDKISGPMMTRLDDRYISSAFIDGFNTDGKGFPWKERGMQKDSQNRYRIHVSNFWFCGQENLTPELLYGGQTKERRKSILLHTYVIYSSDGQFYLNVDQQYELITDLKQIKIDDIKSGKIYGKSSDNTFTATEIMYNIAEDGYYFEIGSAMLLVYIYEPELGDTKEITGYDQEMSSKLYVITYADLSRILVKDILSNGHIYRERIPDPDVEQDSNNVNSDETVLTEMEEYSGEYMPAPEWFIANTETRELYENNWWSWAKGDKNTGISAKEWELRLPQEDVEDDPGEIEEMEVASQLIPLPDGFERTEDGLIIYIWGDTEPTEEQIEEKEKELSTYYNRVMSEQVSTSTEEILEQLEQSSVNQDEELDTSYDGWDWYVDCVASINNDNQFTVIRTNWQTEYEPIITEVTLKELTRIDFREFPISLRDTKLQNIFSFKNVYLRSYSDYSNYVKVTLDGRVALIGDADSIGSNTPLSATRNLVNQSSGTISLNVATSGEIEIVTDNVQTNNIDVLLKNPPTENVSTTYRQIETDYNDGKIVGHIDNGGTILIQPKNEQTVDSFLGIYQITYTPKLETITSDIESGTIILETKTIRNLCAMITVTDNKWSVYTFNLEDIDETGSVSAKLIAGPFDEKIWTDLNINKKPLSSVLRWESDENVNMYVADGIHGILHIPLKKGFLGDSFDLVFGYQKKFLRPPLVSVNTDISGQLKYGNVQYAYRLYSNNQPATRVSPLSQMLSIFNTYREGGAPEATSSKSVNIKIQGLTSSETTNKMQIFRIAYLYNGQMPVIDLIYDGAILDNVIDSGQTVLSVSVSEFIAMQSMAISPKELESKGDYLFAGNIEYFTDRADEMFKDLDPRCYSDGNYYVDQFGKTIYPSKYKTYQDFLQIPNYVVKHKEFDTKLRRFDPYNWVATEYENETFNGIGACFGWKYVYKQQSLSFTHLTGDSTSVERTYRRGDVYRFGVRFFDKDGNASSVKWIADIKMPEETTPYNYNREFCDKWNIVQPRHSGDNTVSSEYVMNIGIEFIPVNTDTPIWKDVAGYEIVQCKRNTADKYTLLQGIVSYPLKSLHGGYLFNSGFLTCDEVLYHSSVVLRALGQPVEVTDIPLTETYKQALLFACPEYTYQPDDVKNLLYKKTNLLVEKISRYFPHAYGNIEFPLEDIYYFKHYKLVFPAQWPNGLFQGPKFNYAIGRPFKTPTVGGIEVGGGSTLGNHFLINGPIAFYNKFNHYNNDWALHGGYDEPYHVSTVSMDFLYPKYLDLYYPTSYGNRNSLVTDVKYADAPEFNQMFSGDSFSYENNQQSLLGGMRFINWYIPGLHKAIYDSRLHKQDVLKAIFGEEYGDVIGLRDDNYLPHNFVLSRNNEFGTAEQLPMAAGGKIMILELSSDNKEGTLPLVSNDGFDGLGFGPSIEIRNLINPSALPYGGTDESSIENSSYVSYGAFVSGKSKCTVFNGDCFYRLFVYNATHQFFDSKYINENKLTIIYGVPIETEINLTGQYSKALPKSDLAHPCVLDKPASLGKYYSQDVPEYLYNTAYSSYPNVIEYSSQDDDRIKSRFDSRVHYSDVKTNNEYVDSWTQFKPINYIDVDSRYGEITSLKLFKDRLIFWQKSAIGILSVNERALVKDENETQISLGAGGVLERFDYISTIYGLLPYLRAFDNSNSTLYWWDQNNKEIVGFSGENTTIPLSTVKDIKNYINTGELKDLPSVIYDKSNKEVLFNIVSHDGDESIVYNENTQQFVSVYTFSPIFHCNFFDEDYVTKKQVDESGILYKYNQSFNGNSSKLFEDDAKPMLLYVVNKDAIYNKTFDILTFGGRFYGGDVEDLLNLYFSYNTPLKQHSHTTGEESVTNREYDFRLCIPRNNDDYYGGRMRGKTMECEFKSDSNNLDFSIQYITTKYRISCHQ